jgi:hypothetical protein
MNLRTFGYLSQYLCKEHDKYAKEY